MSCSRSAALSDAISIRSTDVGGGPMSLSIAFFGSSLVSAYWNGAATYYRGVLQALAANGHRITFYEPDAYDRQRHRDIPDPDWARVVVYPATEDGVERALDDRATPICWSRRAASVFSTRCSRRASLALKRPGAIAAFWDVDAPATLDRIAADPERPVPQADPGLRHRVHLWRRAAGRRPLHRFRRPGLRADLQRPRPGHPLSGGARSALCLRSRSGREPAARPRAAHRGIFSVGRRRTARARFRARRGRLGRQEHAGERPLCRPSLYGGSQRVQRFGAWPC